MLTHKVDPSEQSSKLSDVDGKIQASTLNNFFLDPPFTIELDSESSACGGLWRWRKLNLPSRPSGKTTAEHDRF
jgi:hypothetical protein